MTPAHHDTPKSNLRGVVKSAPLDIKKRSYYFYEPYKNALEITCVHLLSPIAPQKLNPGHDIYIGPRITSSFCMHGRVIYQVSFPVRESMSARHFRVLHNDAVMTIELKTSFQFNGLDRVHE